MSPQRNPSPASIIGLLDPWTAYRNSKVGTAATEPEPAESALMGQGESIGEIIRKKQEELKQKLAEMANEQEILRSDSAASAGVPVESAASAGVTVIAPPGMEGLEMRRPARKCRSRQCKEMHEKKKASTGTQTTISLPHTMREVLWTASSFEPMIDGNESEGVTGILDYPSDEVEPPKHHLNDEVSVGSGVLDLDVLSEENEEEEIKIHGMKADEFYAYIYMLIMSSTCTMWR